MFVWRVDEPYWIFNISLLTFTNIVLVMSFRCSKRICFSPVCNKCRVRYVISLYPLNWDEHELWCSMMSSCFLQLCIFFQVLPDGRCLIIPVFGPCVIERDVFFFFLHTDSPDVVNLVSCMLLSSAAKRWAQCARYYRWSHVTHELLIND